MTTDFKRGQTFDLAGQILNGGQVMSFVGWVISAQLRTSLRRELVPGLTVSFVDATTGMVRLSASDEQTAAWPLGLIVLDIRLRDPAGQVALSDTVTINVVERVTYA